LSIDVHTNVLSNFASFLHMNHEIITSIFYHTKLYFDIEYSQWVHLRHEQISSLNSILEELIKQILCNCY